MHKNLKYSITDVACFFRLLCFIYNGEINHGICCLRTTSHELNHLVMINLMLWNSVSQKGGYSWMRGPLMIGVIMQARKLLVRSEMGLTLLLIILLGVWSIWNHRNHCLRWVFPSLAGVISLVLRLGFRRRL